MSSDLSSDLKLPSSTSRLPSPLVWFLLLDSETGDPYKNGSASSIERHLINVPVIDQFRKSVHRENFAILSDIAPLQLLVYKNKGAFDSRSDAVEERKEKPLKSSCMLNGLGETEEDALVVAVPPPLLRQPSSFPLNSNDFFNRVFNATETGDGLWVSFEKLIPATTLNQLLIRESYKTIASSILKGNGSHKAIITGTPGIGKSLFLFYLLWKLVNDTQRVLFIYHPFNIYYDGKGGVFWFASGNLPLDNDVSFWNLSLWCLFDAKHKNESNLNEFPTYLCNFILSTSPRRDMVNDFKKPPVPQIFYMPIWSETELEVLAPLFPKSVNAWRQRFESLGGIPRHVFEDTTVSPTEKLEGACTNCSLNDCIKVIGMDSTITDKSKAIHSLIHMTSEPPFTNSSVCYASQTAMNVIFRQHKLTTKRKQLEILEACAENPLSAALRGYIFEKLAIELFEKGGTFTCRKLFHGNKKNTLPSDSKLDIPPSKKLVVDAVLPNQAVNQLYVPKSKNYAAIDAWIPGIGAFQMTVGQNHDINGRAKDDLAKLGEANRLYWVLPPENFQTFTKKTPQDIEQYAVMIQYPD